MHRLFLPLAKQDPLFLSGYPTAGIDCKPELIQY